VFTSVPDDLGTPRHVGENAALVDELFTKASELGYGHCDVAALFEVLGRLGPEKRRAAAQL
jgi:hypothetical protein